MTLDEAKKAAHEKVRDYAVSFARSTKPEAREPERQEAAMYWLKAEESIDLLGTVARNAGWTAGWNENVKACAEKVKALEDKVRALHEERFKRHVDDALFGGDGVYRP